MEENTSLKIAIEAIKQESRDEVLSQIKKIQVWDIPFAEGYADGVRLKDLMEIFELKHQESKMFEWVKENKIL